MNKETILKFFNTVKAGTIKHSPEILTGVGIAGMITSWNSFIIGGSRAMFSMAESKMLPEAFAKLNPKTKAPTNAILFIGIASAIAPFFGRKMLVWIVDAGSLGVCVAYLMVSLSFLILRKKEPEMNRPYRVKHGKLVGVLAVIMSGFFTVLYIVPLPFAILVFLE